MLKLEITKHSTGVKDLWFTTLGLVLFDVLQNFNCNTHGCAKFSHGDLLFFLLLSHANRIKLAKNLNRLMQKH